MKRLWAFMSRAVFLACLIWFGVGTTSAADGITVMATTQAKSGFVSVQINTAFNTKTLGISGPVDLVFTIKEVVAGVTKPGRSLPASPVDNNPPSAIKMGTTYSLLDNSATDLLVTASLRKKGTTALLATVAKTINVASDKVTDGFPSGSPSASPVPTATDTNNCTKGNEFTFCNTLFGSNVTAGQYFINFYRWAVGIALLGTAVAVVFAGYKYVMSRGNPSEISSAKEIIVSAIVGLVLLLLSYTILRFLGVNVG